MSAKVESGLAALDGTRMFPLGLEPDEAPRPVVLVYLVSLDREAIGLIGKSWQDPSALHGCLCQRLRRINSDDLYPASLGRVVKEHEKKIHAFSSKRSLNVRNGSLP